MDTPHSLDSLALRIRDIVAANSDGVTAPQIIRVLRKDGLAQTPRTVRRRLQELGAVGQIRVVGEKRGRKYFPAPSQPEPAPVPSSDIPDDYPPLSPAGRQAFNRIRRPRSHRSPVGYMADFLEQYEPGVTWYLDAALRNRLAESGATPDAERAAGTFAREIYHRLLIDLSWASSHLEGNTYSRLDTERLLEFGQQAEGKDASETQMILNHKAAIEMLVQNAAEIDFNRYTLLSLHGALSENLLANSADEGRLRRHPVAIGSSVYTPLAIPQKVEEYFDLILDKARAIPDPFEQAFFVMVHLPYLQPFADANKRTSRLAMNIPLIKRNLVPLSFVDVSTSAYTEGVLAIYELNDVALLRDIFAWAYSRSCQQYNVLRESLGQPDPFRLKYRAQLHNAVRDAIINMIAPVTEYLLRWADGNGIVSSDRGQFVLMTATLLEALNESSAGRYRVTPNQYKAWKAATVLRKSTADLPTD
ncbi:MAG: filamentation induced by cAMP protein Fic [Gemmatimonadetes bacterium]|nr:filamentation induced by cAMP protein Fic [Gemmatimonadota bacterium]